MADQGEAVLGGCDEVINRELNRGRKTAAKVIKFSRLWIARTRNNYHSAHPSGTGCIRTHHSVASVVTRNRAIRAIVIIAGLLISAGTANAITCQLSPPPSNKGHWVWRLIDNKKCWYAGELGMDKSKLYWIVKAPEPAQRTTPEPAKRTAPQPPLRTEPTRSPE